MKQPKKQFKTFMLSKQLSFSVIHKTLTSMSYIHHYFHSYTKYILSYLSLFLYCKLL